LTIVSHYSTTEMLIEMSEVLMNCPECGASKVLCKTRFDEFLVLEFTDAGYGAVHHLTVAAYMLQHSSNLTREGWLHERELLREFLVENKPPAFIRKQNKDLVDSGQRTFKIKSKDGMPVINKTAWKKTILDVRTENAQIYYEGVTSWAKTALEEAEALAISMNERG
jgi:hypothetical protein